MPALPKPCTGRPLAATTHAPRWLNGPFFAPIFKQVARTLKHDVITSLGISDEQWNDKLQQASVAGRRVLLPLCVQCSQRCECASLIAAVSGPLHAGRASPCRLELAHS